MHQNKTSKLKLIFISGRCDVSLCPLPNKFLGLSYP